MLCGATSDLYNFQVTSLFGPWVEQFAQGRQPPLPQECRLLSTTVPLGYVWYLCQPSTQTSGGIKRGATKYWHWKNDRESVDSRSMENC